MNRERESARAKRHVLQENISYEGQGRTRRRPVVGEKQKERPSKRSLVEGNEKIKKKKQERETVVVVVVVVVIVVDVVVV